MDIQPMAKNVSALAKALGAHSKTDLAGIKRCISICVPRTWRPRPISPSLMNDLGPRWGVLQYGIWLDRFPFAIFDPTDWQRQRDLDNHIRSLLLNRLGRVLGARVDRNESRITDRPPHLWRWTFSYESSGYTGTLTVWIVPQAEKRALLILSLTEFRC